MPLRPSCRKTGAISAETDAYRMRGIFDAVYSKETLTLDVEGTGGLISKADLTGPNGLKDGRINDLDIDVLERAIRHHVDVDGDGVVDSSDLARVQALRSLSDQDVSQRFNLTLAEVTRALAALRPIAIDEPLSAGNIVEDTFSQARRITTASRDQWIPLEEEVSWTVEGGRLRTPARYAVDHRIYIEPATREFSNGTASVNVSFDGTADMNSGLIFRMQDADNYY